MKIAALDARVSGEQEKDRNTIASQTEALVAYVECHGYRVAPDMIIEDDGYSGAVLERPGLERVRDLAAEGRIDAVVVHAPDRLSRPDMPTRFWLSKSWPARASKRCS